MEAFQYQALDAAGRTVSGVVQVATGRQARMQLRSQGLLPSMVGQVRTRERARPGWARGISPAELSLATRQMATLLASGLTMEQSLDARQALKQKTGLALLYPILVTIVALAMVTGLLVYVVPQVVQVFQQSRQSLPLLTGALIPMPARRYFAA